MKRNRFVLSESKLDNIVRKSVTAVLMEAKNENTVKEVVDLVLNNKELLSSAISALSPRFTIFPTGTKAQQMKWRMDDFVNGNPEIFKGIMSIPLRKKIATEIYNTLRMKYPNYF